MDCGAAGFFINSFEFNHTQPLVGEGQSAGIGRVLDPQPLAFEDAQDTLAIQAYIALPTSYSPGLAADAGVTALSFYYYVRDTTSGLTIAQVIFVHDNRPPGFGRRIVYGSGISHPAIVRV